MSHCKFGEMPPAHSTCTQVPQRQQRTISSCRSSSQITQYHGSLSHASLVGRLSGGQSSIGRALDREVLDEGAIVGKHLFTSGTKWFGSHHVCTSELNVLVHMMTTGLQQVPLELLEKEINHSM